MKYIISENRFRSIIEKWLNNHDWEIIDQGDLTIYADTQRVLDTFDEVLSISPFFMGKIEGLFGKVPSELLIDWFNDYFEPETLVTELTIADFYDNLEEEDY